MNDHAPHWRLVRELSHADSLPTALQPWLLDTGSLTAKLRARYGNDLVLTLLQEGWTTMRAHEAAGLRVEESERVRLRRIRLAHQDQPLVFARTLIPQPTLEGEGVRLLHLGERALGELVFNEFGATRSGFEVAYLEPPQDCFPELTEPAWARRSILETSTGPVLVTEAFLPALTRR